MAKKPKRKRTRKRSGSVESADQRVDTVAVNAPPVKEVLERSGFWYRLGWWQTGRESYVFLTICVLAQLATILITWPLWELRTQTINLPWSDGTPQIPFGVVLILSLAATLISPRQFGLTFHLIILGLAMGSDQFRCQPQILSVTVLMIACVWPNVRLLCVWYLVSMWFWAGLHKAVSADWFSHVPVQLFKLMNSSTFHPHKVYWSFAAMVTVSELFLAAIASFKPRVAAFGCVLLHLGISVFILSINWNYSVIPWNLCTAIVGCWLLLKVSDRSGDEGKENAKKNSKNRSKTNQMFKGPLAIPKPRWQLSVLIALFVIPVGFYFGVVRHCFAHVLYSGGLPTAAITHDQENVEPLRGWQEIRVPFPHTEKAFHDYFRLTAKTGEKLHIRGPSGASTDSYFVRGNDGRTNSISEDEFFSADPIRGIACDDRVEILKLELAQVRLLKRSHREMVYAAEFDAKFYSRELLESLCELPNIEQLQLSGCDVVDEDLKIVAKLRKLTGIGLERTNISREGLEHLKSLENLKQIQIYNREFSSVAALLKFLDASE